MSDTDAEPKRSMPSWDLALLVCRAVESLEVRLEMVHDPQYRALPDCVLADDGCIFENTIIPPLILIVGSLQLVILKNSRF